MARRRRGGRTRPVSRNVRRKMMRGGNIKRRIMQEGGPGGGGQGITMGDRNLNFTEDHQGNINHRINHPHHQFRRGGRTRPVARGRKIMQAGGRVNTGCTMWSSQTDCLQNGCHWNFNGPSCH